MPTIFVTYNESSTKLVEIKVETTHRNEDSCEYAAHRLNCYSRGMDSSIKDVENAYNKALCEIGVGLMYHARLCKGDVYIVSSSGSHSVNLFDCFRVYSDGRSVDARRCLPQEKFCEDRYAEIIDTLDETSSDDILKVIDAMTPKENILMLPDGDRQDMWSVGGLGYLFSRQFLSYSVWVDLDVKVDNIAIGENGFEFKRKGSSSIQSVKFAKIFKQLFKRGVQMPQVDLERFSHQTQSLVCASKMVRVKGDDILKFGYNTVNYKGFGEEGSHKESVLWKSCMRDKFSYLLLYTENEKVCSLVALIDENEKTIARGLLWDTSDGMYLDRVYYIHEKDRISLIRKAHKEFGVTKFFDDEYVPASIEIENISSECVIRLGTDFSNYPYTDTFRYGGDGYITNDQNDTDYCYDSVDGFRGDDDDDDEDHATCEISGDRLHTDDMAYIEDYGWVDQDYAVYCERWEQDILQQNSCFSEYERENLPEENSVWSEYHHSNLWDDRAMEHDGDWYHEDICSSDGHGDYLPDHLMGTCEHTNNEYLTEELVEARDGEDVHRDYLEEYENENCKTECSHDGKYYYDDEMITAHDGEFVFIDNLEEYEDENCKEECQHDSCMYYQEDMTIASDGEYVFNDNLQEYEEGILEEEKV